MNENLWMENTEQTERIEQTTLAEQKLFPAEHAMLLGKYLPILFWIIIATAAVGLVTNRTGGVLNAVKLLVQSVATGWVMLKLSRVHDGYRLAGILDIAGGVIGFITELLPADGNAVGLLILVLIPSLVLSFVAMYQEYNAHADVMEDTDAEFADKWRTLWKWTVGLLIGLVPGLVLVAVAGMFGLLVLLMDVIGLVVTAVLYAVYLWRMAKRFQTEELSAKEVTSYETTL